MHIFLNGLHSDLAKIGSNIIDQLFKSGRAIRGPDMKDWFVSGELMKSPQFSNPPPKKEKKKRNNALVRKSLTL